jgi:transcription antitermination factor NusG
MEHNVSWTAGPKWFAIYTNIKCEFRAQKGLEAKGFRTFVPRMKKWVSHARMKRTVERPVLCRYIFFEMDPNKQSFEDVRQTDGVECIIANGGLPVTLPRGFIEDLILRQIKGEFDATKDVPLEKGCRVKIVRGIYDNLMAVITGVGRRGLSAKLAGKNQYVRLKYGDVRA